MMKKYTSNKKKVYFFAFLPILATLIIILLAFFAFTRINRFNNPQAFDNELTKQFVQINELKNKLLFTYRFDVNSLNMSDAEFEDELDKHQVSFFSLIDEIQTHRLLDNNEYILDLSDSLKSTYQVQIDNIAQLHAMLKRKGTLKSGLVHELVNLSQYLSDSSSHLESSSLHKSIEDLLIAQNEFISSSDIVSSNILTTYINILENEFYSIEDELIRDNLIEGIHKYRNITRNLIELYERIGLQNAASGFLFEYKNTNQLASVLTDRFDVYVQKVIRDQKQLIIWLISSLSVILIVFISIFYLYRLRKIIYKPLNAVMDYLGILKSGKIPEESLKINTEDEFTVISDHLRTLAEMLSEKITFVKALNKGDLEAKLELSDNKDLLGKELLDIQINTQKAAAERQKNDDENSKRRYINEGLARFSEITHARYDELSKLTDVFIKELVKYLDAIQGGIFLYNNDTDKDELVLTSAFAYDRKKYLSKSVVVGEGLVGTCAVEKRPIFLTEIPPDYISVTSGLGDAPPNNILLLPMLQEEILTGVIELASLNVFQEYQVEFAKQIANSLANTLATTRVNEQTSKLLAQSQEHAQTMSEQEEEMRQNMEELKATQEESTRREEEFKGIADALDKALFVAEFDLKGNLLSINDKFMVFLGKNRKQIIGKTFPDIITSENSSSVDKAFFKKVEDGNHMFFNDIVKIGKRKEYKIQFHFAPELNRDDIPFKILCLGVEMNKAS